MIKQFISAINQLCVEKNIPRDKVLEAVESALKTAYRKDYGNKDQEIDVHLDEESGTFTIYLVKNVVDTLDENPEEAEKQILVADAKKYKKEAAVEDIITIDVTPSGFGRIAAQAAKQVILQRIQEAERDMLYDTFKEREDELVLAQVSRVERGQIFLEIDRNTIILPREAQVFAEKYHTGQRIKVYLERVEKTSKGPKLLISRRTPKLVEKLFEFEIPEVKTGVVVIKGVAREAGLRTKIAVASTDSKIDPIGACVGQKGARIQTIMDELSREMIDVVAYSEDDEKFIVNALAPAKIAVMLLNKKTHIADVFVESDQRPLAIGKAGQNVRLASILTGYEINLRDISEYDPKMFKQTAEEEASVEEKAKKTKKATKKKSDEAITFETLDIPEALKKKLAHGGVEDIAVISKMTVEDLTMIGGIGKASAEKIKEAVEEAIS